MITAEAQAFALKAKLFRGFFDPSRLSILESPRSGPKTVEVKALGVKKLELLTGDNERTAASVATLPGINFRAILLLEDKIRVVKEYQAGGHTVVMVGDGVNDAPALAQANVGIAMGAAGADVALEAVHIPILAAAAQSLSDIGILAKSSRLLRQR